MEIVGAPHVSILQAATQSQVPYNENPKEQNNFVEDFTLGIDEDEDDPFAEVMQKWADEIEEARMYQKRYPGDPEAATQAAAKIQSG